LRAATRRKPAPSVLPDFDLAYFYLIDQRRTPHHDCWVYTPIVWLVLAAMIALVPIATGRRKQLVLVGVGLSSVPLHLVMDSVAADVRWFFPFADLRVNLVHVQAVYKPWYLNFLLHWTIALEVLIWLLAGHFALCNFRARRTIGSEAA
jgi:inner membrane protein